MNKKELNINKDKDTKRTKNTENSKNVQKIKGENEMSISNELLEAITPKNKQIVVKREPKRKKEKKISIPEVKVVKFEGPEPFKNCNKMIEFYSLVLKKIYPGIKFYEQMLERKHAADTLDVLILNGRKDDIKFLKSWIQYYAFTSLKGNNILNKEKTSLKAFKDTFELFKSKYVD